MNGVVMKEIRVCPACNYGRGFHVSFESEQHETQICLICPGCGQSYKLSWAIEQQTVGVLEKGPVFASQEPVLGE
jgi:hypothetical protein